MPLPVDGPFSWATNPAHPPGPAAWNGQPPAVTPSAGQQATGFLPDTPIPIEITNKLFKSAGEWLAYLRDERNALAAAVGVLQGQVASILARIVGDEWTYPATKLRDHRLNIFSFRSTDGANRWSLDVSGINWASIGAGAGRMIWIPFDFIPTGGNGIAGELRVQPGAVGIGANQVKAQVFRVDPTTGVQTAIGPVTNSDGTAAIQNLIWLSNPVTFDRSLYNYYLRVEASTGGSTLLWGGRINWGDIGPRNW